MSIQPDAAQQRRQRIAAATGRSIAADFAENIRGLRTFVEFAADDELEPLKDPMVRDNLETIVAILYPYSFPGGGSAA